ncbi:uncharacterized protein A1O9_03881 [Exophiala aquamarina CBS 119918]|uniref:FAD/NAD(P)-binding domain-containing protein n=1 Tax=Exophiala aquamarina CBS 119918 TaxID=1182545 RepID=A0A072PI89_9EURO|nr:uncharacterized protein A1O9_03881 [Exophiala aquamarina CBS 119918]KEF59038.1 hypothetical protein A1O9_03881 [Exophiala aquamarina CBS 119918]
MAALPNRPKDFDAADHATVNGDIGGSGGTQQTNGETSHPEVENITADILIVGGGFGGMYGMHQYRKLGFSVKLLEAGSSWGGTWHWNRYPGARVDSETPYYSLSIPEVYRKWNFTERFPGHEELRRYFQHVDKTLDLSKDAYFNTIVTEARYDTAAGEWHLKTDDPNRVATCKYLVLATGSSYKKHFPAFKNLDKFKGKLIHSALYPESGLDVSGKKVLVVGSGATGVQIVQTLAREKSCQLTACVRTPNQALPMRQRKLSLEEQTAAKSFYRSYLQSAKQCRSGFPYEPAPKPYAESTRAERLELWEELWGRGGFSFLISNYSEYLMDKDVNREVYAFWAEKVRARISDPVKRDIMAPLTQPNWLGTKRPSLEQDYYEMIDQPHVTILDLKKNNIDEFTATGVVTSDARTGQPSRHDFDIVILATGYDSLTGSLLDTNLFDTSDTPLRSKWKSGTYTYLGLTIPQMPNLFLVYSPQAPTSLSNGPPIIELQIDWIGSAIAKMRAEGVKYIDARSEAAVEWREDIQKINAMMLFGEADSWYMGANIPGKPREQLIYLLGVDAYARVTTDALQGWKGFDVVMA